MFVCQVPSGRRANDIHDIVRRMIVLIMLSSSSGSLGAWFRTSHQEEKRARSLRIWSSGGGLLFYCVLFLVIHDSSITDLVSNSVTQGSGLQGLQSTAEQSKTFDSYN